MLAASHLLFKIVINLKILENPQVCMWSYLFIKLLIVKLLMRNFSAEIFLWTIL